MKYFATLVLAVAAATLTACGGGGGGGGSGGGPFAAGADAQGFWFGPSTSAGGTVDVSAVVLENGEVWGVVSSETTIDGAIYGQATTSGNSVSITGTNFDFTTGVSTSGSYSGTVAAQSTLSLTSTSGTASLIYDSTYQTPATSTAVAGTWGFDGRSKVNALEPGSITIGSTGSFTLAQTGCSSTGTVVPRPGGKNVYNVSVTSTGSSCAAGATTLTGILVVDTSISPNQFLMLALNTGKNDGLFVTGTKQ